MSYGLDTATDGNGMTVITGLINVGATFGDIELKSTGVDFFVVAYNTAGVAQWAQQISGSEGRAAAVDDAGNVFVTGNFSQKTTFGDTDLVSAGRNDIFIVKFNSAGVVQWAIRLGGDEHDQAVAITTDQAGDVLLAGNIAGETIGMWKFSGDGSPLWQIDTPYIHSMTTDASNNVVVAGSHRSTVTIGSDELIGRGLGDAFVASYNSMGIPLWALSAGGPKEDRAVGIDLTPDGNPVVTGNFWDTIFFGEKTFTSRGEQDVFVFQLD